MSKLVTLRPQGNPSPRQTIFEYFNDPLDRVEAQCSAWLAYRICVRNLVNDPAIENEIKAVEARDAWEAAWRAADP